MWLKAMSHSYYLAAGMRFGRSGSGRVIIALLSAVCIVQQWSTLIMPEIWSSIQNEISSLFIRKSCYKVFCLRWSYSNSCVQPGPDYGLWDPRHVSFATTSSHYNFLWRWIWWSVAFTEQNCMQNIARGQYRWWPLDNNVPMGTGTSLALSVPLTIFLALHVSRKRRFIISP